jgi:hypothetical protein
VRQVLICASGISAAKGLKGIYLSSNRISDYAEVLCVAELPGLLEVTPC